MSESINFNFYNLCEQRGYPVDDSATGVDDTGTFLPHGLLVDLMLALPLSVPGAYLAALTVTPNVATAVFASEADGTPLAAVSVPAPVVPYQSYALDALTEGVAGWIVFGTGVTAMTYSGRFSTPGQSRLASRTIRRYGTPPVVSLGKQGPATSLTGLVKLKAGTDVAIGVRTVLIDGNLERAIVFGLDNTLNRNVLARYIGDCNGRPESGTCTKTPLETINGVGPDCHGNIDIDFRHVHAAANPNGGGIILSVGVGLSEACGPPPTGSQGVFLDHCGFFDSSHGGEL